MFQVVDALESFRKDYSKEIILEISKKSEIIVISLPTISIGGRRGFVVSRKWLIDFLKKHSKNTGNLVNCSRSSRAHEGSERQSHHGATTAHSGGHEAARKRIMEALRANRNLLLCLVDLVVCF